jgi:hypothetical protein
MQKSLFALMRGADGRSLARALIVLLLANVIVGGFHLGAMAAAGDGVGVICSLASGAGAHAPGPTQPQNDCPCCALGCALACGHASAVPVEPSLAAIALAPPARSVAAPVRLDHAAPSSRLSSSNGPRSPPLPA